MFIAYWKIIKMKVSNLHAFEFAKTKLNADNILNSINTNRSCLMGVAMSCVLIYHAFCWIYNPIGRLNIGFFGVDMFLFLSGMGLCYSYEKNTLSTFYRNRFFRIFPLYILAVCIAYLMCIKKWSFIVFIENLTTLGYYFNYGANRFGWYISALVTLYVLFPLFYLFAKLKYVGLVSLTIFVFLLMHYCKTYWWYDCLISRLPIFLYGILFQRCYRSYIVVSCIGILVFFPCVIYSSSFLATAVITMPLIIVSLLFCLCCGERIKKVLKFCGQYSLEIYLANLMIYTLFNIYTFDIWAQLLIYIAVQILMTIVFVRFSTYIKYKISTH